jgi:hypothetical protein
MQRSDHELQPNLYVRGGLQAEHYRPLLPHPAGMRVRLVHPPPHERVHQGFQVQVRPPPHAKPHQPLQVQVHHPPERPRAYRQFDSGNNAEWKPIVDDYIHYFKNRISYASIVEKQQKLETVYGWIRENQITFKGRQVNSSDFRLDAGKMLIEYVDSSQVNPPVYIYISKTGKYTLLIQPQQAAQRAVAIVADEFEGFIQGIEKVLDAY